MKHDKTVFAVLMTGHCVLLVVAILLGNRHQRNAAAGLARFSII